MVVELGFAGIDVMVGGGGAFVSTIQPYDVELDVFPAVSIASTSKTCAPSARRL